MLFIIDLETSHFDFSQSKGGPPALTDANLVLGRLIPEYFPKIFGKSEKEPLDVQSSQNALKELRERINAESDVAKDLDEITYGCAQSFVAIILRCYILF